MGALYGSIWMPEWIIEEISKRKRNYLIRDQWYSIWIHPLLYHPQTSGVKNRWTTKSQSDLFGINCLIAREVPSARFGFSQPKASQHTASHNECIYILLSIKCVYIQIWIIFFIRSLRLMTILHLGLSISIFFGIWRCLLLVTSDWSKHTCLEMRHHRKWLSKVTEMDDNEIQSSDPR